MAKSINLAQFVTDPESLNQLPIPELRALWRQCCPKSPPSSIKLLLVRDLARVTQSHGNKLPRQTDILINKAMKAASVIRCAEGADPPKQKAITTVAQRLPEGTKLMREWGGQTHEVTVLADGLWFNYQGQSYKSLTQVAKVITGAHWSGPVFFGLHRFRKKA